jgi:hypothetical protein
MVLPNRFEFNSLNCSLAKSGKAFGCPFGHKTYTMVLSDDLQTNRDDALFCSLAEAYKSFVSRDDPQTNTMKKSDDPQPNVDEELSDGNKRPATVADQDHD